MTRPIKKILLINPSNTVEKECIRRVVTPLSLLYLGAVLENEGYIVKIIDSHCEGYENTVYHEEYVTYGLSDEEMKKRLQDFAPDLVGITCPFSYLEKEVFKLCRLTKAIDPQIVTVTGGIHPSLVPAKMLQHCPELDFIIMREGEYRLLNLISALNQNSNYEQQDGLVFRTATGIKINPALKFIEDLDQLPLPARHLIDLEKYIAINKQSNPFSRSNRVERIFTSRGCPFQCTFCASANYWGRRIRMRSVENVVAELKELRDKYNIKELQFSDDNMTVDRKRALELFRHLKEEFKFYWCAPNGVMMKTLDEEMIKAMAECGCYQLTFSPESGSPRVLKEIIRKPLDLTIVKPLVDLAHKYGINVHSNFITGMPGETKAELMMTFEFAKQAGFDSAGFFIAVPFPGTELYDICRTKGWIKEDTETKDYKHSNIIISESEPEYTISGEELAQLVDEKTREFNEWNKNRNPEEWNRKFKQFLETHQQDDDSKKIMGRVV